MQKKEAKPVDVTVGTNIKRIRHARGISQEGLAAKIGVTFQQLQKYEKATNRVSASALFAIATALQVTVSDLFEGCDPGEAAPLPVLSANQMSIAVDLQRIEDARVRKATCDLVHALAA